MNFQDNEIFRIHYHSDEEMLLNMKVDLQMENAPVFSGYFFELYTPNFKIIILDFSGIRFVDSSGLGALLKCSKTLELDGCTLKIFGLTRTLLTVFKLAGLMRVFEVTESELVKKEHPYMFFNPQ